MKTLASAFLFYCLAFAAGGALAAPKTAPGDYPLAVHVSAATYAATNPLFEIITATIDGKHYQLYGPTSSAKIFSHGNGLLNAGDYHAKLTQDEHKTSYESIQQFEIQFPDGTSRRFNVIAQSE